MADNKKPLGPGGISYEKAEAIRSELRSCNLSIRSTAIAVRHRVPTWVVQAIRKRVKRQIRRNEALAAFDASYRYAVQRNTPKTRR
jgi:hypothetical protein